MVIQPHGGPQVLFYNMLKGSRLCLILKQPSGLPFITSCILCFFVAVMFTISMGCRSGKTVLHERRQLRKNASRRKTILNGWTVNEKQRKRFEYTSSVQYGSSHICGASLIAPDIVLSAAHCFDRLHRYDLSFLKVVVGEVRTRFTCMLL